MKQNGYLVTRGELDTMFLKRPAYSLTSVSSGKHPEPSVLKANYFATCTKVDGSSPNMPYYQELSPIRIARFTVKNYASDYRNVRIGYKVSGGTMQYTDWQYVEAGETVTFNCEGLNYSTVYYFYPEANVTEDFHLFKAGTFFNSVTSGGSLYFTPLVSSSSLINADDLTLMVGEVKVELRCLVTSSEAMLVQIDSSGYNVSGTSLDQTFLIPWNKIFGVTAQVGLGDNGSYTCYFTPEFYDITLLSPYNENTGVFDGYINLELNTGSNFDKLFYTMNLYHEYN